MALRPKCREAAAQKDYETLMSESAVTRAQERPGGSLAGPSRLLAAADWRDSSSNSALLRNVLSSGLEKWNSCKTSLFTGTQD